MDGKRTNDAMIARLLRWGGAANVLGGALVAAASVAHPSQASPAEVFIFPTLAASFPEVVNTYGDGTLIPPIAVAFPVSGALFLAGYLLFGYQLVRTRCISKGSGLALMIGTAVFGFGLSGFAPSAVVRIGAVLFGAGLAWTGLSLRARVAGGRLDPGRHPGTS